MTVAQITAIDERSSARTKAVDRLASGVAHELGTPMNVIAVRAELIRELAESEDVVASAKVIKSQIETMAVVIRRMLDFARRRPLQRERVDLVAFVAGLIESMQTESKGPAIQLQFTHQPDSLFVEVDPAQIDQALRNLLINAQQALPNGGTISVKLEQGKFSPRTETDDGLPVADCAQIQIRDNGVGISKDALPHIFDPFFTTRRGEALGLGLSTANCIIEDHAGWIDVSSLPNQGACFSVFLPLTTED
jgi:two-component system, NtrC family, sensor kinase